MDFNQNFKFANQEGKIKIIEGQNYVIERKILLYRNESEHQVVRD